MKKIHTILFALFCSALLNAQTSKMRLWSKADGNDSNHAELWYYAPKKASGKAVIICPGGSYHHLGLKCEGVKVAEWFNSIGYAAYVLRYRVAMDGFHHPAMLEDMERALSIVRSVNDEHGVNKDSIGVIGFSAGGHLALMAGAFMPEGEKPAWVAAIYPVVSMQDSIAHRWSRKSLIGRNSTQQMKDSLSMEMHLPDDMPPVYIQVSDDDKCVNPQNSIVLAEALKQKNLNYKFNHLATGGHGYGMKQNAFNATNQWWLVLEKWLKIK